jgi:hypothetical protein
MTAAEKLEQQWTGRPDPHVPGRTLARMAGLTDRPGRQLVALNWTMHLSQGAFMGSLRGIMAAAGLRGPWASLMFGSVRLTNDQILENAMGVRAPPWTWPRRELAEDLGHKAVYALVTGVIADALVARHSPGPKQRHAGLVPGRREHVGPVAR